MCDNNNHQETGSYLSIHDTKITGEIQISSKMHRPKCVWQCPSYQHCG